MRMILPNCTRLRTTGALFCLLLCFIFQAWGAEPLPPASIDELTKQVRYLASDDLMGRGVDTPGITLARDYIATAFRSYGLRPGGDHGTFFQSFEVVTGAKIKEPSALFLSDGAPLVVNQDWMPLGLSRSAAAASEVVFVGYGITTRDYDYDDYAGVDVRGKIVLVLRYEPPPRDGNSPFQKAPRYSRYAAITTKANNARNHGAAGMILVDLSPLRDREKELISLRRSLGERDAGIVAVQVRGDTIERWLGPSHISLGALKETIDREQRPASLALDNLKASLAVNLERVTQVTDNVIGVLPGSDPAVTDQAIVIGAHYDHIGLGYFGTADASTEGQIHNGADDNASGTAVLMSVAQRFARAEQRPSRTIVFVAFSGEELGLRGSRYYVEHPAMPLGTTRAMLNMDMVGRMRDRQVRVAGIDTAKELAAWVAQAAESAGVALRPSTRRGGASDHASFHDKSVPALHFYTGVHEDYHRPTDDWEKLNIEGMARVSDLLVGVAERIDAGREPLHFVRNPPAAAPSQPAPASPSPASNH